MITNPKKRNAKDKQGEVKERENRRLKEIHPAKHGKEVSYTQNGGV
jgi:hypothetical protein